MVLAILGAIALVFAAACGIAVYHTARTRPVFRALVTFGLLLGSPIVVFGLLALSLTSGLPMIGVALPTVLLGVGVYIVAEGTVPSRRLPRKQLP